MLYISIIEVVENNSIIIEHPKYQILKTTYLSYDNTI